MILATLDTNVVLAALRSNRGASYRILQAVRDGRVLPAISVALFLEYEEVLTRPEHQAATGLSRREVIRLLQDLAALGERITRIPYRWRPILTDPDDDLVVECAVFSGSDYLVTLNVRDFTAVHALFDIAIVTPGQFLNILER